MTLASIKGNINLVLMHCNIVNGQLLCYVHTEQHWGNGAIFLYYSLSSFSFAFCVFVTLTVPFLFWGASIVCDNNLTRAAELVL